MLNRDKEVIGEVFNCSNITKRKQLESQLQEKNDQLLRLSITDSLTGLFNVRHLNAELAKLIKAQRRFPNRHGLRGAHRRGQVQGVQRHQGPPGRRPPAGDAGQHLP